MRSLRGRLIVWLLAGTGLLVTLAGVLLDRRIGSRLRQDFDADLIAEARSVMAVTEQQNGRVELELSPGLLPQFEARQEPDYFQVWLPGGRILARSPSLGGRDLPRSASPSRRFQFAGLTLPDGRRGRRVEITFRPLVEPDDERTAGPPADAGSAATLVVATGSEALDAFLASLHRTLALFILGLLLGSAVLVRIVTAFALRPLDGLARRLEAIDAGSLREPVVIAGAPSELVPTIEPGASRVVRLWFGRVGEAVEEERSGEPGKMPRPVCLPVLEQDAFEHFEGIFRERRREADEFYAALEPSCLNE